jgi:hypothetical protein
MKTTLDLDDRVLLESKRRAAAAGMTLRAFVEEALRARLAMRVARGRRFKLDLPVVTGSAPPNVDPDDRKNLYEVLDERE